MDDAGQYQCLAENEMGTVKKVVTLVLQSESPVPGPGPALLPADGDMGRGMWLGNKYLLAEVP